jgi:hypothetical protein
MGRDVECTLHRQRGTSKDKVIARATKLELLRHYVNVPPAHRSQYSMWQGDVRSRTWRVRWACLRSKFAEGGWRSEIGTPSALPLRARGPGRASDTQN